MAIKPNWIGIDVGGTKIHAAAVSSSGKIIRQTLVATPKQKAAAIRKIIGLANGLRDKNTVAIGIGVPGPVDFEKQAVIELPNLTGWKNIPLSKIVSKATGLPCTVENDAKCFLLAEMKYGAARGRKNVVGVIIGTGFGSALAVDGKIYRGAHGSAGEVGHTIISDKSGAVGFRNAGELESYASGRSVFERAEGMDAKAVFAAARNGDAKAKRVFDNTAYRAGVGLANIINVLDPEIIVVGGSLSNALPQMLPMMRKVILRDCFAPANRTPVVRHKL
ncbi:MAG: ROK family protein, partial [Candidatus Micrarchaeia archaeon]